MEGVKQVLVLSPSEGNPRNSEGDFIRLEDGRLMFVYTHFTGSASDHGTAHLAGRFSLDNGLTWDEQDALVLPNEGGMNIMSVSLLRLQTGEIALFYLRKNSLADCRCYMRLSTDEARTWSEPTLCIEPIGYFVVNNSRVVQLAGGRLVIPAARHCEDGAEFSGRSAALCFLSDDAGKTWHASESVLEAPPDSGSGLQEPGVIELKDGRLMMLCRTDLGCQYRSWSDDGGVTWTPAGPTDLLSTLSPASIARIPQTGDLLLVWNDHKNIAEDLKGKRTPLTIAVSQDEGQTWRHVKNIEEDPEGWFCYTAIDFADDRVLLAYCAGNKTIGGLNRSRVVTFPVEWIYAP